MNALICSITTSFCIREVANAFLGTTKWTKSSNVLVMMASNLGLPRLRGLSSRWLVWRLVITSARQMLDSLWSFPITRKVGNPRRNDENREYPENEIATGPVSAVPLVTTHVDRVRSTR